jgi:hypothetical protein
MGAAFDDIGILVRSVMEDAGKARRTAWKQGRATTVSPMLPIRKITIGSLDSGIQISYI